MIRKKCHDGAMRFGVGDRRDNQGLSSRHVAAGYPGPVSIKNNSNNRRQVLNAEIVSGLS